MSTKKPTTAPAAENMKRSNFFMPQSMLDDLAKVADKKRMTSAEVVRRACKSYINRTLKSA